ncbi:MAG: DNA (cytosine-5-)-methyltransferase [Actinobacteria bacterium HGW-Actinobacteria-7]|nr:MAG: DNA (cytosine-5-)-methyltransferase [Actinobacteria bacterium HGW-Actinobacteria-7]
MTARAKRASKAAQLPVGDVVELFAGVGGFRLGLEGKPEFWRAPGDEPGQWRVTWSNQWEPSTKTQHAFDCYAERFEDGTHCNEDIAQVSVDDIPEHQLLVGGFPCQDYSVAKPLNQAHGIQGRKGVLWWEIHRILEAKQPQFVMLENVDRLLKSPGSQRGRDFAIILATMSDLGYLVEWRVINAAEYGLPQRRRRVFIIGRKVDKAFASAGFDGFDWITSQGVLARAVPCTSPNGTAEHERDFVIEGEPHEVSEHFGAGRKLSQFLNAGVMLRREVWTRKVVADYDGPLSLLSSVLLPESEVPDEYFIAPERLGDIDSPKPGTWRYLKFSKSEQRTHKGSGTTYLYTEGGLPFPDPIDRAARTILTGEGGTAPSRFKHAIATSDGRFRRLTPVELERLNGFPDNWTEGMSDGKRAFCMGNALVVGVVERIGRVLADDLTAMKAAVPGK